MAVPVYACAVAVCRRRYVVQIYITTHLAWHDRPRTSIVQGVYQAPRTYMHTQTKKYPRITENVATPALLPFHYYLLVREVRHFGRKSG